MKAIVLCVIALLASSALSFGQGAAVGHGQRKSAGFDPKRDAAKDIDNAIVKAKKEHKRILLDVGGEW